MRDIYPYYEDAQIDSRAERLKPKPEKPVLQDKTKRTVHIGAHLYEEENEALLKSLVDNTIRQHIALGLPKPEFKKLKELELAID